VANVELTRTLLGAAAAAGITRVLFLSSIGAVATTSASDVTDATLPAPDAPYGRSKLAAEAIVRETCERTGLGYVVLRPPMVFGPGMKGNPLRLFRAIAAGMPLPVGMAKNRRSMMYVDNLIAAIMSALALPALTRDTFVVGDSAPVSSAELAREIGAALGRPARLLPVPRWMMQSAGSVGDMIDRVVPFPLTSTAVDRLFGSLAVDHSRFARVAGYAPPVDRREAMQRSADWLRQVR
jgi:nucleoside-diphosphate-sugar epimerase